MARILVQQVMVRSVVVVLLLSMAALLNGASAVSSGNFRKSLYNPLTNGVDDVHGDGESIRGSALSGGGSFRTGMTRMEHPNLGVTERIKHLVDSSHARAQVLRSRMQLSGANWMSNVTTVLGGYAMSLQLGTLHQMFSVLVDTGSDLTWVQGAGCNTCFKQPGKPYNKTASTSYRSLSCSSDTCAKLGQQLLCRKSDRCSYTYEYGDLSTTTGAFSTETIFLVSDPGPRQQTSAIHDFAFGVGMNNSGTFDGIDGLMGLGRGSISFPTQLGALYGNVFSYCLVNWSDSASRSSPIIFGAEAVPSGNVHYTPLTTDNLLPTFWILSLTGVSVNGQNIRVDKAEDSSSSSDALDIIIDSGTTVSFLDTSIYQALSASIIDAVKYPKVSGGNSGLDLCFDTLKAADPVLPGTTFHFKGGDWVLPQENTWLPVDNQGTWCLAMIESNQGIQIFGNTQQQNFQVVYDQPNARLGWIKKQCDAA